MLYDTVESFQLWAIYRALDNLVNRYTRAYGQVITCAPPHTQMRARADTGTDTDIHTDIHTYIHTQAAIRNTKSVVGLPILVTLHFCLSVVDVE